MKSFQNNSLHLALEKSRSKDILEPIPEYQRNSILSSSLPVAYTMMFPLGLPMNNETDSEINSEGQSEEVINEKIMDDFEIRLSRSLEP